MGAALIVPVLAILVALVIWGIYAFGKVAQARRAEETLPDDPYERRDEEIRRLRQEHEEARAENVTHPARRP
jgi:hypothetical protein